LHVHMLHYPKDWVPLLESNALPIHVADPEKDRPAYVVEARHGTLTSVMVSSMVTGIAERDAILGPLMHKRMWQMHPVDTFVAAAKKEWDQWGKTIQSMGYDKPHPPYPYTEEIVRTYLKKEWTALGVA